MASSIIRPVPGRAVNVVVIGQEQPDLAAGRVLFDRGRGLVVDLALAPRSEWPKGARVILVYAAGEAEYQLPAVLAEVISGTRYYLVPTADPRPMEKREYIRAVIPLRAALVAGWDRPPGDLALAEVPVELSASGFRWTGAPPGIGAGGKVWLRIEVPATGACPAEPRMLDLKAEVVRAEARGVSIEVGGRFTALSQTDRETLLGLVFGTRLAELGIPGEEF